MKYDVCNYKTGEKVGEVELTETEFNNYLTVAHQPQGTLLLSDLAEFAYYTLDEEHQDLGPDTIVYLD